MQASNINSNYQYQVLLLYRYLTIFTQHYRTDTATGEQQHYVLLLILLAGVFAVKQLTDTTRTQIVDLQTCSICILLYLIVFVDYWANRTTVPGTFVAVLQLQSTAVVRSWKIQDYPGHACNARRAVLLFVWYDMKQHVVYSILLYSTYIAVKRSLVYQVYKFKYACTSSPSTSSST